MPVEGVGRGVGVGREGARLEAGGRVGGAGRTRAATGGGVSRRRCRRGGEEGGRTRGGVGRVLGGVVGRGVGVGRIALRRGSPEGGSRGRVCLRYSNVLSCVLRASGRMLLRTVTKGKEGLGSPVPVSPRFAPSNPPTPDGRGGGAFGVLSRRRQSPGSTDSLQHKAHRPGKIEKEEAALASFRVCVRSFLRCPGPPPSPWAIRCRVLRLAPNIEGQVPVPGGGCDEVKPGEPPERNQYALVSPHVPNLSPHRDDEEDAKVDEEDGPEDGDVEEGEQGGEGRKPDGLGGRVPADKHSVQSSARLPDWTVALRLEKGNAPELELGQPPNEGSELAVLQLAVPSSGGSARGGRVGGR